MNTTERSMILQKLKKAQEFIKNEHRKPKSQRDMRGLKLAKKKTETFNKWLDEK